MNVIVTGASGLLGRAVVAEFKRNSWKVLGLALTRVRDDLVSIDLTNIDAVSKIVREFKPHAIVHCAAFRNPDQIEADEKSCYPLNVTVPEQLAKLAGEVKAVFIFISTDYVFSGDNPPYSEDDIPNPLNAYGKTKVEAEAAVIRANRGNCCILRIPVLYGGEEHVSESAVSSLINEILTVGRPKPVNNFYVRFPSHTSDIAAIIYQLVKEKLQDESMVNIIYHWCGTESFTKFQMARTIAETFGRPLDHLIPNDDPITVGTQRPVNCQLSCERLENLGIRRHTRFVDGIQDFRKFFQ